MNTMLARLPHGHDAEQGDMNLMDSAPELSTFTLKQALDAHLADQDRLKRVVHGIGKVALTMEEAAFDDHCLLGHWIHGVAKQKHGQLAEYHELRDAHAEYHHVAGDIVLEHEIGNAVLARQMLDDLLRRASRRVQLAIVRLYERTSH
jgi:methyl-accepting chemotaxis protein